MKKIKICFTLVFCFTSFAFCQDNPNPMSPGSLVRNNIVKFNPALLESQTLGLAYERRLGLGSSIQLALGWTQNGTGRTTNWYASNGAITYVSGYRAELQWRIYVAKPNPGDKKYAPKFQGLYAAPFAFYRHLNEKGYSYESGNPYEEVNWTDSNNNFGGGCLLGIEFSAFESLYFDFYIGGGMKASSPDEDNHFGLGVYAPAYSGTIGRAGALVGIGF